MRKALKVAIAAYTIISIIAIILLTPYLYKLTTLNIQDVKEGLEPAFPWTFIILTDLFPLLLIAANIKAWKEAKKGRTKQTVITIVAPVVYSLILTYYFMRLIL